MSLLRLEHRGSGDTTRLIKPAALLPFKIDRNHATELFREWIKGLWFAPDALKRMARLDGRLQGLYAPYWTYDADTVSTYTGQRGDNYTVTRTRTVTRDGRTVTETYQDTEIRWSAASGRVATERGRETRPSAIVVCHLRSRLAIRTHICSAR